jgi:NADH-quinone oxidoreductase subunit N
MPPLSFTAEIVLAVVAMAIYSGGLLFNGRAVWAWMAMGGIIVAAVATASPDTGLTDASSAAQEFAVAVRWIGLSLGGLLLVATSLPATSPAASTFVGSILIAVLGVLLVGRADGLVLSFFGLELVGFASWTLLVFGPEGETRRRNAARYLLLNLIGTGILFYGLGFLLCTAGSSELTTIRDRLGQLVADGPGGPILLAKIGLMLILAGLGLKIAAPTVHFRFKKGSGTVVRSTRPTFGRCPAVPATVPDPFLNHGWLASGMVLVVLLTAVMIVLVRVVALGSQPLGPLACRITLLLAMAAMTAGNLMAFVQTNPCRLLVYSSLAQAGYLLMGPAVAMAGHWPTQYGWSGMGTLLFCLPVFAAATIGLFAALGCLTHGGNRIEHVEQLAGLAWTEGIRRRVLAWSIAVFMLSLAGIGPLAGFWARLLSLASIFSAPGTEPAMQSWFAVTAVVCVVNSAVASVYYLKVVAVIFFRTPLGTPQIESESEGQFLAALCSALAIVVVGLYPSPSANLAWINGLPWPG